MTDNKSQSRGFFGYGLDALAGVLSAFILGFAISHAGSVLILLAYLATVPLFLAGLGAGFASGLVAVVCGTAGLFATAPPEVATFYAIADSFPALVLVFIATRQRVTSIGRFYLSEGAILSALVIYPCLIFIAAYAATMNTDGGLLKMTQDAFAGISTQATKMLSDNGQQVTPEMTLKLTQYLDMVARMAPALGMCAWFFSTLIALVAAQSFLCQKQWNLRPAFSLSELRVPVWLLVLAAASIGAAAFAPEPYNYVGLNLSLVLSIPFFLIGLAVIHALAARSRYATAILVVFYILISVAITLVPFVALLGAVDEIADFRKRLTGKTASKNN